MTDHEIIYMIDNLNKSYVAKLGFEHPTFGTTFRRTTDCAMEPHNYMYITRQIFTV